MKKSFSLMLFTLIISTAAYSQGSLVFGVKQAPDNSSAYLGIYQGRFMPYIGADFLWLSAEAGYEETDEDFSFYEGMSYRDLKVLSVNYKGSAFLVVPNIGIKCFLGSKLARPYIFGNVFLALPSVKLDGEGYCEFWQYENDRLVDHKKEKAKLIQTVEIKETITEILSLWGFTFGAGAEYFFDPHFSVGAEYGFRVVFDEADYAQFNPNFDSSYPSKKFMNKWQVDVSASLKVSNALVSLNFYF